MVGAPSAVLGPCGGLQHALTAFDVELASGGTVSFSAPDRQSAEAWVVDLLRLCSWRLVRTLLHEAGPEWEAVHVVAKA